MTLNCVKPDELVNIRALFLAYYAFSRLRLRNDISQIKVQVLWNAPVDMQSRTLYVGGYV